jgi:hypothetical protein
MNTQFSYHLKHGSVSGLGDLKHQETNLIYLKGFSALWIANFHRELFNTVQQSSTSYGEVFQLNYNIIAIQLSTQKSDTAPLNSAINSLQAGNYN